MQHSDHLALLRPGIPNPGGVWADFGSGTGAFTLALAEILGPGATLYSVDQDAGALRKQAEAVKAAYPGVELYPVTADFTQPLKPALPPLDGLIMANALNHIADRQKEATVRLVKSYLKPGGRMLVVEYNVDQGNSWVPYPLSFKTWDGLAKRAGFTQTRQLATRPSSFLKEFYSAETM